MFLTLCRPLVNERLREIIIMHGCVTLWACLLQCSAAENRCDYNQTKLHSRETIYPHLGLFLGTTRPACTVMFPPSCCQNISGGNKIASWTIASLRPRSWRATSLTIFNMPGEKTESFRYKFIVSISDGFIRKVQAALNELLDLLTLPNSSTDYP